jgi:hypothetical protein
VISAIGRGIAITKMRFPLSDLGRPSACDAEAALDVTPNLRAGRGDRAGRHEGDLTDPFTVC